MGGGLVGGFHCPELSGFHVHVELVEEEEEELPSDGSMSDLCLQPALCGQSQIWAFCINSNTFKHLHSLNLIKYI